jgi:putative transposase
VKVFPTLRQKQVLDEFFDTSRYVYNRTLQFIKNGHKVNFQNLRDILVTENTKKNLQEYKQFDSAIETLRKQKSTVGDKDTIQQLDQQIKEVQTKRRNKMKDYASTKNPLISRFEIQTPKDIRSNAVASCCNAHKAAFTNLRNGNIKFFNMKYKKKTDVHQCIELTPKIISIVQGKIKIVPNTLGNECYLKTTASNKKKLQNVKITNNVDITRHNNQYYVHLLVGVNIETAALNNIAGIDLGLRTFATVHTHQATNTTTMVTEYVHRKDILKKFNVKMDMLKSTKKKHIRKKQLSKIDKGKKNLVDRLHWDFINDILQHNDVVYLGDIKSHDIVKGGKNKTLNRCFNDLKFYKLKQRLLYKASLCGKKVFMVPEHYTTKTCSSCGVLDNNVGSKEIFDCEHCRLTTGRDINASKNIKMKGMLSA